MFVFTVDALGGSSLRVTDVVSTCHMGADVTHNSAGRAMPVETSEARSHPSQLSIPSLPRPRGNWRLNAPGLIFLPTAHLLLVTSPAIHTDHLLIYPFRLTRTSGCRTFCPFQP